MPERRSGMLAAALLLIIVATLVSVQAPYAHASSNTPNKPALSEPVNLSQSGGAIDPLIAAAPNGDMMSLWWDVLDGTRYSRSVISGTTRVWSPPQALPAVTGGQDLTNPLRPVTLPPVQPSLEFGADNIGHLLFRTTAADLLYASVRGGVIAPPVPVARNVLALNSALDVSGTLHLSVVLTNTKLQPAGIYYARRSPLSGSLSLPKPVFLSPYFRTAQADDVTLSVASDARGNVLVTWSHIGDAQSRFVRSSDDGVTWSEPAEVAARSNELGLAADVSVAHAPGGELLMLWRDASAPGCGFTQRKSINGGETWSTPERVFGALTECPGSWRFSHNAGSLWFVGAPRRVPGANGRSTDGTDTAVTLAAWNGARWSDPVSTELRARGAGEDGRALSCIAASLNRDALALVGCDSRRDVFVASNAISVTELLPALQQPWSGMTTLSQDAPAGEGFAVAQLGNALYAAWHDAPEAGRGPATLRISVWNRDAWTRGIVIHTAAANPGQNLERAVLMDSPALAAAQDRVFLVWRGGESGRAYFSSAFVREVESRDGWSEPQPLPAPSAIGGAPSIAADPRGSALYVLYPVLVNEGRGVYALRSNDAGVTWSAPVRVADGERLGWDGVDAARIAIDPVNGVLHAAWLRVNAASAGGARTLYSAHSSDGGSTWSEPRKVADGMLGTPQLAIGRNGVAMLAWRQTKRASGTPSTPGEVWTQFSPNSGRTWSAASKVEALDAISGDPALLVADSGQMMLGALGATTANEGALLTSDWLGDHWSASQRFALGQPAAADNGVALALHPRGALHAVLRISAFQGDGALRPEMRAISRYVVLAEAVPVPTFTPLPPPQATASAATATPLPTMTPLPQPVSNQLPVEAPLGGTNGLLIAGAMAAFLSIVVALVVFTIVQRR
jgi:hypothetical protein